MHTVLERMAAMGGLGGTYSPPKCKTVGHAGTPDASAARGPTAGTFLEAVPANRAPQVAN